MARKWLNVLNSTILELDIYYFRKYKTGYWIKSIIDKICFLAQIQEKGVQDVESRWETAKNHEFQKQFEEVPGASDVQQCWEGDQDVHQRVGSKFSLSRFRRWVDFIGTHLI